MKCIITGTETDNKWNGFPICKNAIAQAKAFMQEDPNLTMRKALLSVSKVFKTAVNKKIDDKIKEEIKKKEESTGAFDYSTGLSLETPFVDEKNDQN